MKRYKIAIRTRSITKAAGRNQYAVVPWKMVALMELIQLLHLNTFLDENCVLARRQESNYNEQKQARPPRTHAIRALLMGRISHGHCGEFVTAGWILSQATIAPPVDLSRRRHFHVTPMTGHLEGGRMLTQFDLTPTASSYRKVVISSPCSYVSLVLVLLVFVVFVPLPFPLPPTPLPSSSPPCSSSSSSSTSSQIDR